MVLFAEKRASHLAVIGMALAAVLVGMLLLCAPQALAAGYQKIENSSSDGSGTQFTNGKNTVFMQYEAGGSTLYVTDNQTGQVKLERPFSVNQSIGWHVTCVYANQIYLTRIDDVKWKQTTYSLDMTTKKLTKRAANCDILATNGGRFVVASNTRRTDVGPQKLSLYEISPNGKMAKVRTLAKHGLNPTIIGKSIYFGSGTSNLSKIGVYRCKINGSGKVKLGGPWKAKPYDWGGGMVLTPKIKSKYCIVIFQGAKTGNYKFTYKTKKLKKLSDAQYTRIMAA